MLKNTYLLQNTTEINLTAIGVPLIFTFTARHVNVDITCIILHMFQICNLKYEINLSRYHPSSLFLHFTLRILTEKLQKPFSFMYEHFHHVMFKHP